MECEVPCAIPVVMILCASPEAPLENRSSQAIALLLFAKDHIPDTLVATSNMEGGVNVESREKGKTAEEAGVGGPVGKSCCSPRSSRPRRWLMSSVVMTICAVEDWSSALSSNCI